MTSPDYKELPSQFTDNFVRRVGDQVIKSGSTIHAEAGWYHAYEDKRDIPKIYSLDPGGLVMEWIESEGSYTVDQVLNVIDKYRDYQRLNDNGFQVYRDRIKCHLLDNPIYGGAKLMAALCQIDLPPTFCHGDLSCNNILPTKNGIKLIDPLYSTNFGSHWLDYAKLAFSFKFYRGDVNAYNEILARTGVPKVLIVSECVRVATYRRQFNFISENLINELL